MAVPERPWNFDDWFVAQHGKRPSRQPYHELEAEAKAVAILAAEAKSLLERVRLWDERRTSAMYAWNIKDGDKK
jgi:hypothetical protein